ncbi:MAG: RNA methyltransferase [Bdellovibrionaceae bacterium]|nr:RNA methyltransferase [Pseudobdellovibrionaceae bacterium]
MEQIRIVLVRPKYPRNIGMVARAMANYGLKHLIIIEPQCVLDQEANEGAANAQDVLRSATIYPHWQRFYDWEHEGIRIAFSARDGRRRETFDFMQSLTSDEELQVAMFTKNVYLIFGPEDHGLAETDLDFVHRIFQMKLPGTNQSLNLSHAVLNVLCLLHSQTQVQHSNVEEPKESFFFPDQTIRRWLETLNLDLDTHQRVNAYTVIKRLMLKGLPNSKELHMLETVLQQTIRKLKERSDKKSDPGMDV